MQLAWQSWAQMPATKGPNSLTMESQSKHMRGSLCFTCQNPDTQKKFSTSLQNHFIKPKLEEKERYNQD
jgi:hypothetical protein